MGWIVPRLMDFDEGPINESNWNCGSCHQNLLLLNSGRTNLVGYGKINARCDKYVIVIYHIFVPIPHESIIFSLTHLQAP